MIHKIGLLCSREYKDSVIDNKLIIEAFSDRHIDACEVVWDDEADNYDDFDAVIVRSTWGYHKHYKEYLKVIDSISSKTIMLNSPDIIRNNSDKSLQYQDCIRLNIPCNETVIVTRENMEESQNAITRRFGEGYIVLKPNISAGGCDTMKIYWDSASCIPKDYLNRIIDRDNKKIIVQKYVDIISEGEFSLIYICGKYSHAIRRFPGILLEKRGYSYIESLPDDLICFGDIISKKLGAKDILYVRIDLVVTDDGPTVLEIEMNEPDLFYRKCGRDTNEKIGLFVDGTIELLKEKHE